MAKTIDATFDPSSKWKPIEEGVYPAHVKSLETKEVSTRAGEAIVVNMRYKVADEVTEYTQPVWEMDGYKYVTDDDNNKVAVTNGMGKQATTTCEHLKGRELQDNGFFVFTDSGSSSKNRRYFELLDNLKVKCTEANIDGKTVKKLVLLEEEDVVGKPVMVTVKRQEFVTFETKHLPPDQQERRSTFKVTNVNLWEDGQEIAVEELEEDVPF